MEEEVSVEASDPRLELTVVDEEWPLEVVVVAMLLLPPAELIWFSPEMLLLLEEEEEEFVAFELEEFEEFEFDQLEERPFPTAAIDSSWELNTGWSSG